MLTRRNAVLLMCLACLMAAITTASAATRGVRFMSARPIPSRPSVPANTLTVPPIEMVYYRQLPTINPEIRFRIMGTPWDGVIVNTGVYGGSEFGLSPNGRYVGYRTIGAGVAIMDRVTKHFEPWTFDIRDWEIAIANGTTEKEGVIAVVRDEQIIIVQRNASGMTTERYLYPNPRESQHCPSWNPQAGSDLVAYITTGDDRTNTISFANAFGDESGVYVEMYWSMFGDLQWTPDGSHLVYIFAGASNKWNEAYIRAPDPNNPIYLGEKIAEGGGTYGFADIYDPTPIPTGGIAYLQDIYNQNDGKTHRYVVTKTDRTTYTIADGVYAIQAIVPYWW